MTIEFAVDGGLAYIPALAAPITIDTATLPPDQAKALEELVEQANFFSLPPAVGKLATRSADQQTYTITIHDNARSHVVRVTDAAERPEVAALVRALQRQSKERRGR